MIMSTTCDYVILHMIYKCALEIPHNEGRTVKTL